MSIESALDRLSGFLLAIGCVITFLMMAHVAVDVLSKWLFGHPLTGTLEIVTFIYMSACIFLPLGAVQRQRGQITVEVFTQSLSPRMVAGIDAVAGMVSAIFILALAWQSGRYAILQTLVQETTLVADREMAIWYARWFPALGLSSCGLYFLLHACMDAYFAATGSGRAAEGMRDATENSVREHGG
jgi:TRAP-type C4-dicarboxylate transport system permease small subunit